MFIQNTKSNKEDPATKIMGREFPFNSDSNKGNTQEMDSPSQPKPADPNPGATTGHLDSTLPLIKQLMRKTTRNKVIMNNNLGRKRTAPTPKAMAATEKVAFVNRVLDILRGNNLEKQADLKGMLVKALQTAVGSRTPGTVLGRVGKGLGKGALNFGVPLATGGYTAYKAHESGMSPFSSGMLGLAAGSVASPKMYASAARAGMKSPEGPVPGFLGHLVKPLATKALFTGVGYAPELIKNTSNTLNSVQGTAKNMESATNKLNSVSEQVGKNITDATRGFSETSEKLQGDALRTGFELRNSAIAAGDSMRSIRDATQGISKAVDMGANIPKELGKGIVTGGLEALKDTDNIDGSAIARNTGREFSGGIMDTIKNTAKNPYVWGTAAGLGGLYGGYKLLDKYMQYKAKTEQAKARAMMPPKPPKPNVVNLDDVLARLNRSQHPGIEVPQ